jgi:hypothetical protein
MPLALLWQNFQSSARDAAEVIERHVAHDAPAQARSPSIGSPGPQINLAMQPRNRNLNLHGGRCERFLARSHPKNPLPANSIPGRKPTSPASDCAAQQMAPLRIPQRVDIVEKIADEKPEPVWEAFKQ